MPDTCTRYKGATRAIRAGRIPTYSRAAWRINDAYVALAGGGWDPACPIRLDFHTLPCVWVQP